MCQVVEGQANALGSQFQAALVGIQSSANSQVTQVIEALATQHQATIQALAGAFGAQSGGQSASSSWQGDGGSWGPSPGPQSWGSKPEPWQGQGDQAWQGQGGQGDDHDQDWGPGWPDQSGVAWQAAVQTPPGSPPGLGPVDPPGLAQAVELPVAGAEAVELPVVLPLAGSSEAAGPVRPPQPPTPPQPKWPAPPVPPAPTWVRPLSRIPMPPPLYDLHIQRWQGMPPLVVPGPLGPAPWAQPAATPPEPAPEETATSAEPAATPPEPAAAANPPENEEPEEHSTDLDGSLAAWPGTPAWMGPTPPENKD